MNSSAAFRTSRLGALAMAALLGLLNAMPGQALAQSVAETREIVYSSGDAQALRDQAAALGTPVAIYEYLRNNTEFVPYWGSTSGSVNAFMGRLGNDVDLASALIAMLRSRGIPARYAVATIRLPNAQVFNWLGVGTPEVAQQLLTDSGIPTVARASSDTTFDFEHVWVQALVPFDQYRGLPIESNGIDCNVMPGQCAWVPLDPSYKQKIYNGLNLDPFPDTAWDDADYTAYYEAIKNGDARRQDKNPLAILEQDVLDWLHADPARAGMTIDDVLDKGQIVEVHEGLLPASLPYQVIGTPRVYDSAQNHDDPAAGEANKWERTVTITVIPCDPSTYTGTTSSQAFYLNQLATDRLVLVHSLAADGTVNLNLKQGRPPLVTTVKTWNFGTVACAAPEGSKTFAVGTPFHIKLETDTKPNFSATAIKPAFYDAVVGARYLVAIGGENSNWSQVHRAAESLLASSQQYKIVYDAAHPMSGQTCDVDEGGGCLPYVDIGPAGWDSGDPLLTDTPDATEALAGGLLEVAGAQYYAKVREHHKRADGLMKIKTPIHRFLGVVQSNYDVQYLQDSTAFSIQPNGLVIDMKGFVVGWSRRINSTSTAQTASHFLFLGHVGSSLEHETWQELTGFDATSAVRAFQLARAANSPLKTYSRDAITNDATTFLTDMGFVDTVPAPFAISVRDIYGTRPTSWSHPTLDSTDSFDLLKRAPGPSDSLIGPYKYKNNYLAGSTDSYFQKADACEQSISSNPPTSPWTYWSSYVFVGTKWCGVDLDLYDHSSLGDNVWMSQSSVRSILETLYTITTGLINVGGSRYLDVFDENRGFRTTDFVYRTGAIGADLYSTGFVAKVWKDLYFADPSQGSVQYLLTQSPASDANYKSEVFLLKKYDSGGAMVTVTFGIAVAPK